MLKDRQKFKFNIRGQTKIFHKMEKREESSIFNLKRKIIKNYKL